MSRVSRPAPLHPPRGPHCPLRPGGESPAPSPPPPGLAEPQTPLRRVTASSAARGKLFVINHVLKDGVMGALALPLLPRLRSPSRQAGPEPMCYKPRSQKKKMSKKGQNQLRHNPQESVPKRNPLQL